MRRKVFEHYIILILICISVMGFFASRLANAFYSAEVAEKLINSAALIKHGVSSELLRTDIIDYDYLAGEYAAVMQTSGSSGPGRVTFISFDGKVLGESDANSSEMENHLDRKEVRDAINGSIGRDIRFSRTLNVSFLYVAVPIKDAQVVLRVSVPLSQLERINRLVWLYVFIALVAGLAIAIIPAYRFSSSLTAPINELNIISHEIALGNYSRRAVIKAEEELGQLARSFNDMALKLENTVADLTEKNIRLDSIIDSLTNGIIAVDLKFRIIFVNSIACRLLDMDQTADLAGSSLISVFRNTQVNDALTDTIQSNNSNIIEITMGYPEEKHLRIYTSPIKSKNPGGISISSPFL